MLSLYVKTEEWKISVRQASINILIQIRSLMSKQESSRKSLGYLTLNFASIDLKNTQAMRLACPRKHESQLAQADPLR